MKRSEMKQPIEPNKDDCCNSGCNPCIFDVYDQQLKLYKKYLETGQNSNIQSENGISLLEYTKFVLLEVVEYCTDHIQLFFGKSKKDDSRVWWKPGDHFLLKYNNGDKSCTRAYTPLNYSKQTRESDFTVIVKLYENGHVSNYLKHLKIGDITFWRGPYGSYDYKPNEFKRIVMIAQGTGIAPFINIIETILENEDDISKIVLYYCTKNEDSIIMREKLYNFKDYWNFSYKIFLSRNFSNGNKCKYQEPVVNKKLCLEDINLLRPFSSSDQFLLCGSNDFMKNYEALIRNETFLLENIHLF